MIRHILADGTELKSIEGRIVPPTGKTAAVYKLIAELIANSNSEIPGKGGIKWNTRI